MSILSVRLSWLCGEKEKEKKLIWPWNIPRRSSKINSCHGSSFPSLLSLSTFFPSVRNDSLACPSIKRFTKQLLYLPGHKWQRTRLWNTLQSLRLLLLLCFSSTVGVVTRRGDIQLNWSLKGPQSWSIGQLWIEIYSRIIFHQYFWWVIFLPGVVNPK